MNTPYQNHIDKSEFEHVYEPAEDSFLLIDAIEKDLDLLKARSPALCLEVGSGSGVVITAFGMAFPECFCLSTDVNERACNISLSTAKYNKVSFDSVRMDLMSCFIGKKFDVILFNPPYVVTDSSECKSLGIEASWAGGLKGREVIDRFLSLVPKILSDNGICYMLVIEENIPEEIKGLMYAMGFCTKAVIFRKVGNEKQYILKMFRSLG